MNKQQAQLFLHLSDIHFGQEKGGKVHIHNDVKERLIDDVRDVVSNEIGRPLSGIIVSGDTAYSGVAEEFMEAGKWLDRVANAGECKDTDVHVVPGNHDIDREKISGSAEWMLAEIQKKGEDALDKILSDERDCEVLYDRLGDYRAFAEGYGCPLDLSGGHAGDGYVFSIGLEQKARFLGLNSALACSADDKEGQLILGAKQRVLCERAGEVMIVLCHHPLNWLNDAVDAWKYLRRSASVFISGHEHEPSVTLNSEVGHSDILLIAAGATVPPKAEGPYNFAYNFLEFGWNTDEDCLAVSIYSRCWDDERKMFGPDKARKDLESGQFLVKPHGKEIKLPETVSAQVQTVLAEPAEEAPKEGALLEMADISASITLRFFRDLSADQRRQILVENGILPSDWSDALTHTVETLLFRQLLSQGDPSKLEKTIIAKINEGGETK